jgi:cytosine/adenosine deaminase-related metal-dependent hydrolase
MATINGARAIGVGTRFGTIEAGKFADVVIVKGNPLADITNTRNVQRVIKAGELYNPAALLKAVEGKLGPAGPDQAAAWGQRTSNDR